MSDTSRTLRRMNKQTRQQVTADIRRVLWEVWDPISVNDDPRASAEYDGYANSLYTLLAGGASDAELSRRLHQHETVDMELAGTGNAKRAAAVKALQEIDLEPTDAP